MRNKIFKASLVCASIVLAGVSAESAEGKFGYVDMQKAIQATTTGKKAKAELEGEFSKKKKDFEKKEADLKKMSEDLERKKSVLSEDVLMQKQREFQEEMMKYREVVGKSQMELQKKERDLTAPILDKLRASIEKVAKDGGYTMIFEKNENSILWAPSDMDLTNKIVAEYEKSVKK